MEGSSLSNDRDVRAAQYAAQRGHGTHEFVGVFSSFAEAEANAEKVRRARLNPFKEPHTSLPRRIFEYRIDTPVLITVVGMVAAAVLGALLF